MAYVAQLQRELHAGHVWRPLVVPVQPLLETDAGHEDRVAGVWRADETHCDDVAVDGLDHAFGAVDEAPLDVLSGLTHHFWMISISWSIFRRKTRATTVCLVA